MMTKAEPPLAEEGGRIRAVVSWGAEMAGGAAGGALGFVLGGPGGAALGGVGGVAVSKALVAAGEEACNRLLSPREKARVGATIAIAADTTRRRLEQGDIVRDDGFVSDGTDRPPIEETTEGLLLAAQRAYDEKKVPYIGRLAANLNFRPDMKVQAASVLVRLSDQLTYQQLCLLRLAVENQTGRALKGGKYKDRFKSTAQAGLLSDFLQLYQIGVVNNGGQAALGIVDIDPPEVRVQGFGVHLFELMELNLIPEGDLQLIRSELELTDPTVLGFGQVSNAFSPVTLNSAE